METVTLLWTLAQLVTERSYPSAVLWFFGAILLIAGGIIVFFEGLDALRAARRALARRLRGDGSVAAIASELRRSGREKRGEGVHLSEPDTRLRRRFFRRIRPVRRPWEGGRANDLSRHWKNRLFR